MPDPETDTRIVRIAIHPGIGITRVGNSTDEYNIAPEVTAPRATSYDSGDDPMRDASGNIKREGARFRLYGYNAAGEAVREILPGDDDVEDITWTVHVANRKAEWFRFVTAMDIPEATGGIKLRNPTVSLDDRSELVIDPGPKTLSTSSGDTVAPFDGGEITFASPQPDGDPVTTEVPLGEMRLDDTGRLVVLGGLGKSDSPINAPIYDESERNTFNNADGWYDDISDGPVRATITIGGETVDADPAWVAAAPPNYAPDAVGWRTLYDLLQHTYIEAGRMDMPETIDFTTHILPILYRLTNLQWVNAGFASMFGADGPMDFSQTGLLKKLSHVPQPDTDGTPLDPYQELRRTVFHSFRSQDPNAGNEPRTWPWIYGDGFGTKHEQEPNNNLPLPSVWETWMETWVAGDFVEGAIAEVDASTEPELTQDRYLEITTGLNPNDLPDDPLSALDVKDQPAMLDKANLHFCLADAFHPGCELTWPMRHNSLYASPFRIRHAEQPKPLTTTTFSPEQALAVGGPLYGQRPGDLTRWMAIPWQGDTASCRSGYHPNYDPYLPTFWPASAPNQVLAEEDYDTIMDDDASDAERVAAFHRRRNWLRGLFDQKTQPAQMKKMITDFVNMGFVERRNGPKNHPHIPSILYVETVPDHHKDVVQRANAEMDTRGDGAPTSADHLAKKAGFTSQEHVEEMQRMWKGGRR